MRIPAFIVSVLLLCPSAPAQAADAAQGGAPRFVLMDVMVDSGAEPLAAYQVELVATNHAVKIVGIEGGDHAAFATPPYYDPAALQRERVIIGAFSLAAAPDLPRGLVRVASLHCMVAGDAKPMFNASVTAAATSGGRSIALQVNVGERTGK